MLDSLWMHVSARFTVSAGFSLWAGNGSIGGGGGGG